MAKGRLDAILGVAGWSRCETVRRACSLLAVSFHVDRIHVIC